MCVHTHVYQTAECVRRIAVVQYAMSGLIAYCGERKSAIMCIMWIERKRVKYVSEPKRAASRRVDGRHMLYNSCCWCSGIVTRVELRVCKHVLQHRGEHIIRNVRSKWERQKNELDEKMGKHRSILRSPSSFTFIWLWKKTLLIT